MAGIIATTYGDALFEAAKGKDILRELWDESSQILMILKEHPEFLKLLNNPKISRQETCETVKAVFGGRIHDEILNLMYLMIEKGRQASIPQVLEYYISCCKEYYHIGVVHITAPMPLSGVQQQRIEADIIRDTEYKKLEVRYTIDPSILGGLVIRIGDRVLDTSVRSKLNRLTRELYKTRIPSPEEKTAAAEE